MRSSASETKYHLYHMKKNKDLKTIFLEMIIKTIKSIVSAFIIGILNKGSVRGHFPYIVVPSYWFWAQ